METFQLFSETLLTYASPVKDVLLPVRTGWRRVQLLGRHPGGGLKERTLVAQGLSAETVETYSSPQKDTVTLYLFRTFANRS